MLNFLSFHRNYNLSYAFCKTVSLWEVRFRSQEIVDPRHLKVLMVVTVLMRMLNGGVVGGLLLKSTIISRVLSGFISRSF